LTTEGQQKGFALSTFADSRLSAFAYFNPAGALWTLLDETYQSLRLKVIPRIFSALIGRELGDTNNNKFEF